MHIIRRRMHLNRSSFFFSFFCLVFLYCSCGYPGFLQGLLHGTALLTRAWTALEEETQRNQLHLKHFDGRCDACSSLAASHFADELSGGDGGGGGSGSRRPIEALYVIVLTTVFHKVAAVV